MTAAGKGKKQKSVVSKTPISKSPKTVKAPKKRPVFRSFKSDYFIGLGRDYDYSNDRKKYKYDALRIKGIEINRSTGTYYGEINRVPTKVPHGRGVFDCG